MARMRWMHDRTDGLPMAVCLYCDREVAADPEQSFYCYCRSSEGAPRVIGHELSPLEQTRAA